MTLLAGEHCDGIERCGMGGGLRVALGNVVLHARRPNLVQGSACLVLVPFGLLELVLQPLAGCLQSEPRPPDAKQAGRAHWKGTGTSAKRVADGPQKLLSRPRVSAVAPKKVGATGIQSFAPAGPCSCAAAIDDRIGGAAGTGVQSRGLPFARRYSELVWTTRSRRVGAGVRVARVPGPSRCPTIRA